MAVDDMPAAGAAIDWPDPDGGPVSRWFADGFFSREGGLAEARHVFLAGNGLPARLRSGFHVAELGFGTGLNLLAVLDAWPVTGGGRLRYTSFEAFPLAPDDLARALEAFPTLAANAGRLAALWRRGARRFMLGAVDVEIVTGDARETLPAWAGRADAWFLDGFAPARNPELWEPSLLAEVARHTTPGGTFATYTAAGHVRRALGVAGFDVERAPGYGRKRHMSRGRLRPED